MKLSVAQQFSETPGGRYVDDGPHSGEAFRETLLRPALERGEKVMVDLDGTEGYGSSFIEEAFGGLVRLGYFSSEELKNRLEIITDDESLTDEVWDYISEAEKDAGNKR